MAMVPDPNAKLMGKVAGVLRQPDAVLFVGSGISLWSGLPSWPGLIRELAEYMDAEGVSSDLVRRELNQNELLQAASYGVDQLTPQQFAQFMHGACRVGAAKPHDIHRKLVSLPPTFYITTNYDSMVEESVRLYRPGEFFHVVTNKQITETAQIIQATAAHVIFKPHGDVGDSSSVILTREQYRSLHGDKRHVLEALKTLLVSRPVVFIGFGLRDIDFIYLKDVLANIFSGGVRDHYAIIANASDAECSDWRRNFGIHLLAYSAPPKPDGKRNDHSRLLGVLDELSTLAKATNPCIATSQPTALVTGDPDSVLALARYAGRLIQMCPSEIEDVLPLQVSSATGHRQIATLNEILFDGTPVETFIHAFPSSVILRGNPGAGKTFALRRHCAKAGRMLQDTCLNAPDQIGNTEIPFYVDLKAYRGRLWEMASGMLPPALSLPVLCGAMRVRFYLDGVNEVPREFIERGVFEADVKGFVHNVSPCVVILASRTDEGLASLELPTYQLDEISPTFVEQYLQERTIEFQGTLKSEMIAFLQKPLFFHLIKDGRICLTECAHPRQLFGSYFEFLSSEFQSSFGFQISIAELLAPLGYHAIDSGQEAVPLADVTNRLQSRFKNPRKLKTSLSDMINWLISQDLLIPAGGIRLSFFHQSVTEYLAAKELALLYSANTSVLEDCLRNTRWDQAVFMAIGFLSKDQANQFTDRILATDLAFAMQAAKFLEFDRHVLVSRLLDEVPNYVSTVDMLRLERALDNLPLSQANRQQLVRITNLGDMIGASAGRRLAELAGREAIPELLPQLLHRADDYNFGNGIGECLKELLDDNEVTELVAKLREVVAPTDRPVNEMGIVKALSDILRGRPVPWVMERFGPVSELTVVQTAALCEWLGDEETEEGFTFLVSLVKQDVPGAIVKLYFRLPSHDDDNKFIWAHYLDETVVWRLVNAMSSDDKEWAARALTRICRLRSDLQQMVHKAAEQASGLVQIALFCASNPLSPEVWESLGRLADNPISPQDQAAASLIGAFNCLAWKGHEELVIKLLRTRNRELAREMVDCLFMADWPLDAHKLTAIIGPLDWWWQWMSEGDDSESNWFWRDRLAGFLLCGMDQSMQQSCIDAFNSSGCEFRSVMQEHVMWRIPFLTSDRLTEGTISYLLADMEKRERSVRGFLLGSVATEQFVVDRLLPLLNRAEEPLKSNLVAELHSAGERHRRRYITLEDEAGNSALGPREEK